MPLGREVGFCPDNIVLDGDPPTPKGHLGVYVTFVEMGCRFPEVSNHYTGHYYERPGAATRTSEVLIPGTDVKWVAVRCHLCSGQAIRAKLSTKVVYTAVALDTAIFAQH